MATLTLDTTPAFEAALNKLMRVQGASQTEVILKAVETAAATVPESSPEPSTKIEGNGTRDLLELRGWALQFPERPNPPFLTEDDLYKDDL